MPTADQRNNVRYDLDTSAAEMGDTEIDTLYTRAGSVYTPDSAAAEAYVRLLAVRRLRVAAAKRVDYKQNQSSESLGQLFDHLSLLEKQFLADLDLALNGAYGTVRIARLRRGETKWVDLPDDFTVPSDSADDISRLES